MGLYLVFFSCLATIAMATWKIFDQVINSLYSKSSQNLVRNSEDEAHLLHYENTSMQYTAIFQMKFFAIFLVFAKNIDCGYTLEPPH